LKEKTIGTLFFNMEDDDDKSLGILKDIHHRIGKKTLKFSKFLLQ
jgi:hypothetical protein